MAAPPGRDPELDSTRIDRWSWAVRLYKTRSQAADACERGQVQINGASAKAAAKVRVGDHIEARVGQWTRVVEVVRIIDTRVGAAVAAQCLIDRSPPPPERGPVIGLPVRDRGAGRPTKRDRRELERIRAD